MKLPWWSALVAAAVGFGICYWWPAPAPATVVSVVSDTVYLAQRPDTVLSWRERLIYRAAVAETITVTRQRFDTVRVARFCEAAADTTVDSLKPPPILPVFSGNYRNGRLQLFATRSDGSGWSGIYTAHAPFEWASGDHTVSVHPRRRLPAGVRVGLRLGLCAGLGFGVREATGAQDLALAGGGGCAVGVLTR